MSDLDGRGGPENLAEIEGRIIALMQGANIPGILRGEGYVRGGRFETAVPAIVESLVNRIYLQILKDVGVDGVNAELAARVFVQEMNKYLPEFGGLLTRTQSALTAVGLTPHQMLSTQDWVEKLIWETVILDNGSGLSPTENLKFFAVKAIAEDLNDRRAKGKYCDPFIARIDDPEISADVPRETLQFLRSEAQIILGPQFQFYLNQFRNIKTFLDYVENEILVICVTMFEQSVSLAANFQKVLAEVKRRMLPIYAPLLERYKYQAQIDLCRRGLDWPGKPQSAEEVLEKYLERFLQHQATGFRGRGET